MKFYIHTLGCKVNAYESEVMQDLLLNNNYEQGTFETAEIFVINTCCVTNVAEKKSLQMIRKFAKENRLIIVVGCLSQVKPEEIQKLQNVDIILGNQDKSKIVSYIQKFQHKITNVTDIPKDFEEMKLNNYTKTRAFVKIQDGCENYCTYCIIPSTRGKSRSKNKDTIIEEIKNLLKNHKEIVLTGIHTGNYNYNGYKLHDLIKEILPLEGLKNLRISSIEITEITNELIYLMENNKILVDHMHIPLQSGTNEILKSMNRKYTIETYEKIINKLRKIRPNISITTDVITGFPNETDQLYEATYQKIKQLNFTKLHVFGYSKREGTVASTMENQIPENIKKQRIKKLTALSKQLELQYMNEFINTEVKVLVETYKDGYLIGHTDNYLLVKFKGEETQKNTIVNCLIKEVNYPNCLGEKVSNTVVGCK